MTVSFAMILVALAGLFVFGGIFALIVVMATRSTTTASSRPPQGHDAPTE